MHGKGQASIHLASYNMHFLLIASTQGNGPAMIIWQAAVC